MELLGLPLGDEYAAKRLNGLNGVRNILWSVGGGGASAVVGGLTREKFMNEAFLRMTAAEQVVQFRYFFKFLYHDLTLVSHFNRCSCVLG